jgi:8-oxo-dGTP diphosphatase
LPKSDQGAFPDRYMVIPRTLIFITSSDKVLLLKGSPRKRLWAGKYNGVGGHIERGESALVAARRELFEETRLEIHDLWLCGTVLVDVEEKLGIAIYVFRGVYEGGAIKPSSEGTLEWIPISDLKEYDLVEDLFELLPRVLKLSKGDAPFAARYYYEGDQLRIELS